MASNAELQAEVDRLNAEADELASERDRLAEELAEAKENQKVLPNTRPQPTEPSFKLSAGQQADLEMRGHTVSPWTGARQVGTGKEDVQVVDQATYDQVAKAAAK